MSKHKCDQSTTLHRSPQVLNGLGETLSGSQSTPTNRWRLANGTQVHFLALTGVGKQRIVGRAENVHIMSPQNSEFALSQLWSLSSSLCNLDLDVSPKIPEKKQI